MCAGETHRVPARYTKRMAIASPEGAVGAVSTDHLQRFKTDFHADPRHLVAMNAVCSTPVSKVAIDRARLAQIDHTYSIHLPESPATSQKASGRCWLFASLNTLRARLIKKLDLAEDFELSQNYFFFWDKLEKANFFLENILLTLDEPVGSRLLDHLLTAPVQDGGQWHMFVNLVKKYGLVPKSVMPESDSSSNSRYVNFFVTAKLRECACRLRENPSRELKDQMMSEIYRMLCIHLGEPPTDFEWQWRDKERNFDRRGRITPQEFFREFIGDDLDDYVCLIHDPRPGHSHNALYTVEFLGNVVNGEPIAYLNTDINVIKQAAIAQLQEGESVWHGCDVGKYLDRDSGLMDLHLMNYELVYNTSFSLDKAQRLQYGHSLMTHAMVFTGVNLDANGKPNRWRVENSWSDEPGQKGFFQMGDDWFSEYCYEVAVRKRHVPKETLAALETEPIVLPPWDPMGSLA